MNVIGKTRRLHLFVDKVANGGSSNHSSWLFIRRPPNVAD